MAGCFSYTVVRDRWLRRTFSSAGLRRTAVHIHGGDTTIRCWIPRIPDPWKPSVVLIHGFGANATWQWDPLLRPLVSLFNVYVPDLIFFGGSTTTRSERTETFQAEALAAAMDSLEVRRASLVGISYGGFVAYRMAALYPERVERIALCCAGVCLEEKDLEEGLFAVDDIREAERILVPQKTADLRRLLDLSLVNPPRRVPSCFLSDFIQVMCMDHVEEKAELLRAIIEDRKLSELPKISQPTLVLWADKDRIFPLELGLRLNRHLGGNSKLVVIKDAGHAMNIEKPKEFCMHVKSFLIDSNT